MNKVSGRATGIAVEDGVKLKTQATMPPTGIAPPGPLHSSPLVKDTGHLSGPEQEIGCEQAIQLMGAYLSHEMTFWQRHAFVQHLRTCVDCHDKLLVLEVALQLAAGEYAKE